MRYFVESPVIQATFKLRGFDANSYRVAFGTDIPTGQCNITVASVRCWIEDPEVISWMKKEGIQWMKADYLCGVNGTLRKGVYFFNKDDAMRFKLRWG